MPLPSSATRASCFHDILCHILLSFTSTPENPRGPQYTEQAFAAIHQANLGRLPIQFLYARHNKNVSLYCRFPPELSAVVQDHLAAAYPDCRTERLPETALDSSNGNHVWSCELRLRPDLFAIRRYPQFEDVANHTLSDPLSPLLTVINAGKSDTLRSTIQITVRPASRRRYRQARRAAGRLASPFLRRHFNLAHLYALAATSRFAPVRFLAWIVGLLLPNAHLDYRVPQLTTSATRTHDREEDLQAATDKLGRHLFEVWIGLSVSAPPHSQSRARAKLFEMAGAFGQFTVPRLSTFKMSRVRCTAKRATLARRSLPSPVGGNVAVRGFLLSCEELATLWHPPTETVRAPAMQFNESRELEAPVALPSRKEEDVAVLGRVKFRARREVFGVRRDDRRRHLAVIGKTGMGKTTLLRNLIASDIEAGRAIGLIDPHGDLADSIIDAVPKHRTNDVILFDAADREYPLSFNTLACADSQQRPLVASGIVSAFKKLYGDSWGPRLEHILRNGLLALLEVPGTSLLSLQRLLSDSHYRKTITGGLTDPVVRAFWQQEFAKWKPNFQAEAVAPIQNKVGQFLSHPILRSIVGQSRSSLDLRTVMDEGRILIVNLSKGKLGEDASTLLGSLLVTSTQLAAMSRAEVPEERRRDFYLYVDEFQDFATESFATILSEARKYRLNLTIANQYLAQMDEATLDAVFGNVGSLLCFQVGARDSEVLAEQLGGDATLQDLLALPKYTAYLRLLIDGMPSRAFSMETLPPPRSRRLNQNRSEIIRRASRRRYARPAAEVTKEIDSVYACA